MKAPVFELCFAYTLLFQRELKKIKEVQLTLHTL